MTYYNEFDPKAAAWLRELIKAGLIPAGDVDERSITGVNPYEISRYTQHHFFAGIGGWAYALRLAGWPDDRPVRTGSCPCQPFSSAGKKLAEKDERHLWPVFRDLIAFGEPAVTFGEQVASALGRAWLDGVSADLEGLGFAVGAADLCAAGIGAPHIRQRLYWVAHPNRIGRSGRNGNARHAHEKSRSRTEAQRRCDAGGLANGHGQRLAGRAESHEWAKQPGQPAPRRPDTGRRGADGRLVDAEQSRLEGYAGHGDDGRQPGRLDPHAAGSASASGCAGDTGGGFWSDFELVHCLDGKARRTQPGLFPLAHGIPGRVGLLRGYGNAIVPQVAAEFVTAYLEATRIR